MVKIINTVLTNSEDEVIHPQTSIDQVFDKKTGVSLDQILFDSQLKMQLVYDSMKSNKIFNSLEDIGLTPGTETIEDIVKNLPSNSTLIHFQSNNNPIYPHPAGLLTVVKYNAYRVAFTFENEYGYYVGFYNFYYKNIPGYDAWTGWKNLLTHVTSFESIGLTAGEETIVSIKNNLPLNTTLNVEIHANYGNSAIYPAPSGLLTVKKFTGTTKVQFIFQNENGYYVGFYNAYYEDIPGYDAWTGWKNLLPA